MSIAWDLFCCSVTFMITFAAVLSVFTDAGGSEWPIYASSVHMHVAFWKFSNSTLNPYSVAEP